MAANAIDGVLMYTVECDQHEEGNQVYWFSFF